MTATPATVRQLLEVLERDREDSTAGLLLVDRYLQGDHDKPYLPDNIDDEYRLLADRCVANWMPLLVSAPAQACYVDGFRPGTEAATPALTRTPQWDHWQRSRMDARQAAIYRGALGYGHSFTVTELDPKTGRSRTRGLSPLRTAALYEDPAFDDAPVAALTVTRWPRPSGDGSGRGRATLWDEGWRYEVSWAHGDFESISLGQGVAHGASECPVTRFAAHVDLDGRTTGVVAPLKPVQDRINQTLFDLLVAQTYSSIKVRYVTGMAPPLLRDDEGELILDANGNPKPIPMNHNARRFLFAEDPDVKFGTLDESPLGGFIEAIDLSIRHLSAISQTPPHHLLGQIANLSAEALQAAETSFSRMVDEFRKGFGESWERVFRLAMEIDGESGADDYHGEVIWRDMEARSMSQIADALGKLREQLAIPARGLWARVPGVTQNEIDTWQDMAEEDDAQMRLASSLERATAAPFVDEPEPGPEPAVA